MKIANSSFMDLAAWPFIPAEQRARRLEQNEWQPIKAAVHQASGLCCAYCGGNAGPLGVCDHLVPLARGGTNERSNLVTACDPCNARKGLLTPAEFERKRAARAA